jgi:hypothetical protein
VSIIKGRIMETEKVTKKSDSDMDYHCRSPVAKSQCFSTSRVDQNKQYDGSCGLVLSRSVHFTTSRYGKYIGNGGFVLV